MFKLISHKLALTQNNTRVMDFFLPTLTSSHLAALLEKEPSSTSTTLLAANLVLGGHGSNTVQALLPKPCCPGMFANLFEHEPSKYFKLFEEFGDPPASVQFMMTIAATKAWSMHSTELLL
jgi:hypothetical protein